MRSEMRFGVVQKKLEQAGWSLARISGSHHIFTKAGQPNCIISVHRGKVEPIYVRQVERAIRSGKAQGD